MGVAGIDRLRRHAESSPLISIVAATVFRPVAYRGLMNCRSR